VQEGVGRGQLHAPVQLVENEPLHTQQVLALQRTAVGGVWRVGAAERERGARVHRSLAARPAPGQGRCAAALEGAGLQEVPPGLHYSGTKQQVLPPIAVPGSQNALRMHSGSAWAAAPEGCQRQVLQV
jgi:hypothetical protein